MLFRTLALISVLSACAGSQRYTSTTYDNEVSEIYHKYTVRILTKCPDTGNLMAGSGFLGDNNSVYTAKHVVDCGAYWGLAGVVMHDGQEFLAVMDEVSDRWDTIRLRPIMWVRGIVLSMAAGQGVRYVVPVPGKGPVTFEGAPISTRIPKVGEWICAASGDRNIRFVQVKCGGVFLVLHEGFWSSILAIEGNSGGPIFDQYLNVIGVISMKNATGDLGAFSEYTLRLPYDHNLKPSVDLTGIDSPALWLGGPKAGKVP